MKKKIQKDKTGAGEDTGDREAIEGEKHDTENTEDAKRKEEE